MLKPQKGRTHGPMQDQRSHDGDYATTRTSRQLARISTADCTSTATRFLYVNPSFFVRHHILEKKSRDVAFLFVYLRCIGP